MCAHNVVVLHVDTNIGYPDYITKAADIDKYYEDYETAETLYESSLKFRHWYRKISSDKLNKKPDRKE